LEKKIGSGKKCALSSSKFRAALKKQTAVHSAKSYRELGRKIQVQHNTVKKYLTKMGVHRKAKKSAPNTTARQKFVIKARLKRSLRHSIQKNPKGPQNSFEPKSQCHYGQSTPD
jgi:hypothetical protein